MYHVSVQGIDECMINVHCYYYWCNYFVFRILPKTKFVSWHNKDICVLYSTQATSQEEWMYSVFHTSHLPRRVNVFCISYKSPTKKSECILYSIQVTSQEEWMYSVFHTSHLPRRANVFHTSHLPRRVNVFCISYKSPPKKSERIPYKPPPKKSECILYSIQVTSQEEQMYSVFHTSHLPRRVNVFCIPYKPPPKKSEIGSLWQLVTQSVGEITLWIPLHECSKSFSFFFEWTHLMSSWTVLNYHLNLTCSMILWSQAHTWVNNVVTGSYLG